MAYLGVEGAQLDVLGVADEAGVAVLPEQRHRGLLVSVDQQVEAAGLLDEGQEGHRGGDLAHDGLDLAGDLLLRLAGLGLGSVSAVAIRTS